MLTSEGIYPATTVAGLETNTLWDGLFHIRQLGSRRSRPLRRLAAHDQSALGAQRARLVGWMLVGWGLFNLVEGVLDHHILTIHRVREGAGVNEFAWDVAFLLFGAFLVIGGWLLARSNQSASNPN